MGTLIIRRASAADANAISALIRSVTHHFTVHPDGVGAEQFLIGIEPDAVAATIADPRFNYLAGFGGEELVGVVVVRDTNHLYHLFVQPDFQRSGIASNLWRAAKAQAIAAGNRGDFTVNSSCHAVPVYERFGFRVCGPRTEKDGVVFVPMRLAAG